MKAVKINFVHRRAYPWIWGIAGLIACGLVAGFMAKAHQVKSEKAALTIQAQEMQSKLLALQASKPSPLSAFDTDIAKKRQANQIALTLQSDVGKALRTLETLKIPAVKLRNLTIDNAQGFIDIDLELGNLVQVSAVGEALSAGYAKSPWILISASAQVAASVTSLPSLVASANPTFVGKWRAKLADL
jgi:hypothetical protein